MKLIRLIGAVISFAIAAFVFLTPQPAFAQTTPLVIAPQAIAQTTIPPVIRDRTVQEDGVCICNDDYTGCICCETVLTPPLVACDLVIEGEEVTDETTTTLTVRTGGEQTVIERVQPRGVKSRDLTAN